MGEESRESGIDPRLSPESNQRVDEVVEKIKAVSRETQSIQEPGQNRVLRDEKGRILPGQTLNPGGGPGRPPGKRDFMTDFEEAIRGIKDKSTGEQLTMQKIIQTGLQKMMQGNGTKFEGLYMDLVDRVYGRPKQVTELTGKDGDPLVGVITPEQMEIAKKINEMYSRGSIGSNGTDTNAVDTKAQD
jgi:hypothetical protein